MTQAEIDNHIEISERLLQHAEEQFENRDLLQASEKAWGAVAHYLKSVAKFRGWQNRHHRDLNDIADDLALETDDPVLIRRLYAYAERMHQNFYEDRLSHVAVAQGISDCRELIERLERRAGPEVEPRPSQEIRRWWHRQ